MFGSPVLEVAIGMAFLFLAVSLICTAIREWLEGILKWRAMDLERGLRTLLDDGDGSVTGDLLRHPMLYSLFSGQYDPKQLRSSWLSPGKGSLHMRLSQRRHLPSYIPAAQFAVALLDSVARGPVQAGSVASAADADADGDGDGDPDADAANPAAATGQQTLHPGAVSVDGLRSSALNLASPHLQRVVLAALDHSNGDLAQARQNIERWFDGTMDRVSGWYKRRTQALLFVLGLAIAAAMNIDALHVMQRLTVDQTLRQGVVSEATLLVAAAARAASAPKTATPASPPRTSVAGRTPAGNRPGAGQAAPQTPATPAASAPLERVNETRQALERLAMPIGWRDWTPAGDGAGASAVSRALPVPLQLCKQVDAAPCERAKWLARDWLMVLCGWLLTAFGVMLGAPFWFDVLNKFVVIRATVKPHEKSREEASEDRQAPPTRLMVVAGSGESTGASQVAQK